MQLSFRSQASASWLGPCCTEVSPCTGRALVGAQVHKARLRRAPGRKPAARRSEEGGPLGLRLSLRAQPSWRTVGGFGGGWVPGSGAKPSSVSLGTHANTDPSPNGGGPGSMGRNGGSDAGEDRQDGVDGEPSGGARGASGGSPSMSWRVAANQELLLGSARSADAGGQAPRSRTCARTAILCCGLRCLHQVLAFQPSTVTVPLLAWVGVSPSGKPPLTDRALIHGSGMFAHAQAAAPLQAPAHSPLRRAAEAAGGPLQPLQRRWRRVTRQQTASWL